MVMGKTINLIRFFIVTCVLFFCSVLNGNAQAEGQKQTKLVDYVWAVDVSGGSNIYLADVQQAIDSFYVKASRYGSLDVIRYASSVINDSTVMDDEFYKHRVVKGISRFCAEKGIIEGYVTVGDADVVEKLYDYLIQNDSELRELANYSKLRFEKLVDSELLPF